ncbi:S41 family peptidase [Parabacteroides bouchesdurhonensis]|uniref:S41 family peptidase n=1 Tax=Parabacteroides bouchesdurhonensis TaxID=1936995 RepID=UPI000E548E7B|nr:S41 family peptidase [Parabacteroides bouchesdurhonensis]RHJ91737.1 hypothetical protein DW095_09505 [Bacteroides sp. AM07-16]
MKIILKSNIVLTVIVGLFSFACQNGTVKSEQNIEKKVQNLETFARLYGYARWFHPSDEAQEIDWDKFAILGVQKVENIKSTVALRDTLYSLFSPIVQGLQIYDAQKPEIFKPENLLSPDPNAKPVAWQHYGVYLNDQSNIYRSIRTNKISHTSKIFDRMPQFGEITKASIGDNLICVVPLTLQTNGSATYPKTEIASLNRLKSELSNIGFSDGFNQQVNLASVIITWNVLQHFFPYFDVINTDWNKVLEETLKSTLFNNQKKDFFVTLSKMIAQINDGHGVVFSQKYCLPLIRTEYIENKIVITASKDTTLKRGDIIHKINGKPAMEVLDEKEKIISGSPQLRRYRALNILTGKFESDNTMNEYAFIPENNKFGNKLAPNSTQLVIERNGREQNVNVTNNLRDGNIFFNLIDERKYLFETIIEIEPDIYYVNMARCTANVFERTKEVLANAKAVIYDQRGGSNLGLELIISHLIEKPVNSTWWNIPQTVYPDRKMVEFDKSNSNIQPRQPLFKSKSIIINTPAVVSSGETMMGIIDHYNLATTIGESTAGCNGNINRINLPCGYSVMWTGMKVLKHDGSQLYLKGFEPDYPVKRTIQAVKGGRDEYLEKALEVAMQVH